MRLRPLSQFLLVVRVLLATAQGLTAESAKPTWSYTPEAMRPFWQGTVMEGESVLFIKDARTGEARASVLFPVREMLAVRNSAGNVTYENGRDYVWKPESREIVLPVGSRIPSRLPSELRRPAKSQKYELTHRDGNGEIFFGARLEYAEMQTCLTYSHAPDLWKVPVPKFNAQALPRSVGKLSNQQPLSIVVVGDSISSGCNASGWADGPPYQPAYPELLRRHLEARYQVPVTLENPSVSGTDTNWVLTMIDKVVESKPDLVIVAFGMNGSAGRGAKEYQANTAAVMAKIRERLPDVEFILVASMLGNRDWIRLKHELFPQYRDALAGLCGPGVALADLTSVWAGFLEYKQDWDQTGNGVNHPNDFGHRVYAQVLSTLLVPDTAEPVRRRRVLYNFDGDSCLSTKAGGKGPVVVNVDDVKRLIEEVVRRYDCDGIELDFNRFPTFFKDGTTEERVAQMNSLVERVRKMLDEVGRARGRRQVLAVRVPSNYGRTPPTPETARQLGCDVPAWVKQGWVDFVAVSEFLFERGDLPIGLWKQAVTTVPVYGGIECTRGGGQKNLTADEYRLAATNLLKAGADGVYLFNFFTSREGGEKAYEPPFEALRDLGQALKANDGRPISIGN